MAIRNQDDWNDDYRRGQGTREWDEDRRARGEWRAGRGGYEGRGYEGRRDEERDFGRYGREDSGRGFYGREDFGRGSEGREDFGRGYGREDFGRYEGREDFGRGEDFWRGGSQVRRRDEGRYEDRWGGGRMGRSEDFGQRFERGFERGADYGPGTGRYGMGQEGTNSGEGGFGREGYGGEGGFGQRYGEQRQGRTRGYGRLGHTGEDFSRGVGRYEGGGTGGMEPGLSRYIGGGWAGLEPEMGRDYRGEDYGRSGGLRSIGYGMARMDVGERRQGRGPKGYQRSDDRIREDLCERLMRGWMNAENVDVRVSGGEVTLTGNVDSRDEKRAIEDLAEEVLGVKEVNNQLRVSRGVGAQGTQAAPSTGVGTQGLGTSGTTGTQQTRTDTQRQDSGRQGASSNTPMHHS